jgi:hypothetical protein
MQNQFNKWFWAEFVVAFLLVVAIYFGTRYYYKTQTVSLQADALRKPVEHTFSVVGLLLPVLVAVTSYLFSKNPSGSYPSLLATLAILFLIVPIAIWHTFALVSKTNAQGVVALTFPNDTRFIAAIGMIYVLLFCALGTVAVFLITELQPVPEKQLSAGSGIILLQKPAIRINQSREDVLVVWGVPVSIDSLTSSAIYETDNSTIKLQFDSTNRLQSFTQIRR